MDQRETCGISTARQIDSRTGYSIAKELVDAGRFDLAHQLEVEAATPGARAQAQLAGVAVSGLDIQRF